jgi:hypothetical protein
MKLGRKVFMDFRRNPVAVPGDVDFDISRLDADVSGYLERTGALLATPIERLRRMNPLSIELYKRYKRDLALDPLECAMNNQHMNGGIAVDTWGQTSLPGCYAIGESAGTHGVTRPGGSALNAGQVFGTRCAEHIAFSKDAKSSSDSHEKVIGDALNAVLGVLRTGDTIKVDRLRDEIQARMSESAGIICYEEDVTSALEAAGQLNDEIRRSGISCDGGAFDAVRALQWRHNALASEAVLAALDFFIRRGGGSRGARAICSSRGDQVPLASSGPLEDFRFVSERIDDRLEQILVRMEGDRFAIRTRPLRTRPGDEKPVFERNWPDYLTGRIFASE